MIGHQALGYNPFVPVLSKGGSTLVAANESLKENQNGTSSSGEDSLSEEMQDVADRIIALTFSADEKGADANKAAAFFREVPITLQPVT